MVKHSNTRRLITLLFAVLLTLAMFPAALTRSFAQTGVTDPVTFYKATADSSGSLTWAQHTIGTGTDIGVSSYNTVESSGSWGTAGNTTWYVVKNSLIIDSRISVSGTVNLILCDGVTLTLNQGISLKHDQNQTLCIYGQGYGGQGDGTLIATGVGGAAGIGGNLGSSVSAVNSGNLFIHGGRVVATGTTQSAGIGGGGLSSNNPDPYTPGSIVIYGGTVTATGGVSGGAGIGGGSSIRGSGGAGGSTTITGGQVTANGNGGGAGIGAGSGNSTQGSFSTGTDGHAVIITNSLAGYSDGEGLFFVGDGYGFLQGGSDNKVTITTAGEYIPAGKNSSSMRATSFPFLTA